jgi:hypothetical protein
MAFYPPGVNMAKASTGGGGGSGITGVLSKSYGAPPAGPYTLGDSYIVADPASGLWTGYEDYIVTWDGSQWLFVFPTLGQLAYVADEGIYYTWDGVAWVAQTMAAHGPTHEQGATDPVPSLPTTDEKDALVGTFGIPSLINPYVTSDDPRLTGSVNPPCPTCANATYLDGAYHVIASIPILDDSAMLIEATAVARRTDAADRAGYSRKAIVYREAGGAATLQGTIDTPLTRESNTQWNVTIGVNGNNAEIRVRGAAASTVNWNVCWVLSEVFGMLTTADAAWHTIATIPVQNNTVLMLETTVVARRTNAAGRGAYLRKAIVYREGGGAATIQGTVDSPLTRESAAAWDVTIAVSGSNVLVKVRGAAGQTVHWKSSYVTEEIS